MSLPATKLIADLETIKLIADERRLALLRKLAKPQTVKELSVALDVPQAQLYYHVNLLEKHGLIQVVDTQVVSGIIEKYYQATAQQFGIRNPLLFGTAITDEETTAIFGSMLDETKEELRKAFKQTPARPDDTPPLHPFVTRKALRLTQEQLVLFHAKLDALIKECDTLTAEKSATDVMEFSLMVAFIQCIKDEL